jgi:Sulfotransferase family
MSPPAILVAASCHRSGSTWMQRVLHAGSDIFMWGEDQGVVRDLAARATLWRERDGLASQELAELLAHGECGETWAANARPPAKALHEGCRLLLESVYAETHGRTAWGWKAVDYDRAEIDFVRELFPDLRVVLLVRNVVDVYLSLRARGWDAWWPGGLAEICDQWCSRSSFYCTLRGEPNFFFVRYEDARAQLPEVVAFAGGRWSERTERAARLALSLTPRASLHERERQIIDARCGAVMATLGYSLADAWTGRL